MRTKRQVVEKIVFYFRDNYDNIVNVHRAQFPEGICSFEEIAYYAFLEYALYQKSGDRSCILYGIRALADLGRLSDEFLKKQERPESHIGQKATIQKAIFQNGRPWGAPMDGMFRPFYYLQAVRGWKRLGVIGQQELCDCERAVSRALGAITAHTDWGPQNRGMIKGVNLLLAAECFPYNEEAALWQQLGEALVKENLGQWSVEDAEIYLPVWLNALLTYEELFGGEALKTGQVKFYFDYMVSLLSPLGVVPDFGDARFGESTEAYICCLEKGAALYQDGRMKAAANRLWDFYEKELLPGAGGTKTSWEKHGGLIKNMAFIAQAMLWESSEVVSQPLSFESRELLEDLIGKKYRLAGQSNYRRDYLFLNYRDEGNYGCLPRYYIQNTLAVENEKTHHGHGDENAIVLLLADDTVLLHDGGYRETGAGHGALPGNYRSDFFHNRMVFRRELWEKKESLFTFFSKEHGYCPVTSRKLYFETFPHCDVGRTRVTDEKHAAQYDRTVIYLKKEGVYIVIDTLMALKKGDYTAATLYFTGEAKRQKEYCYRTQIVQIGTDGPENAYQNRPGWELELTFLNQEYPVHSERLRRCYAQETGLCQYDTGHLEEGEVLHMVTMLEPVRAGAGSRTACRPEDGTDSEKGLGLVVETECGSYHFQHRTKLCQGDVHPRRRPSYDWEHGGIKYGEITTDAVFSYVYDTASQNSSGQKGEKESRTAFGLILGSCLSVGDRELFRVPASEYIQPDFSSQTGRSYWNRWYQEDTGEG